MGSPKDQREQANGKSEPPEAWQPARRALQRAIAPVERFLHIEAASGLLLLVASVIALVWANSPWRDSYAAIWHTPIGLSLGPWSFERDLHFWINDGLMAIFFFVVGLEIRREIHRGELSQLRRAALPLAGALGGMAVPAAIFAALNIGRASIVGWGVPMATDIAFAVGVLALLGKRVPPALRILLLALAVIDDVGAIVVIAVFYSSGISMIGIAIMLAGIVAVLVSQWSGIRSPYAYVVPALVIWAGTYAAGMHPTLAGVIIGLMTPVRAWYGTEGFLVEAEEHVRSVRAQSDIKSAELLTRLDALKRAEREAVSPVERLEHAYHGWVAFGVMPLFALANAGVPLGSATLDSDGIRVFVGVIAGLVLGKPLGVMLFSFVATRLGIASLPTGVTWRHLLVVGVVAGIGFTMALFVAQLAFPAGAILETSKLAILCASAAAAVLGLAGGWLLLPTVQPAAVAPTAEAAEQSTES